MSLDNSLALRLGDNGWRRGNVQVGVVALYRAASVSDSNVIRSEITAQHGDDRIGAGGCAGYWASIFIPLIGHGSAALGSDGEDNDAQ